jgi:hypothetical protein
LQNKLNYIDVSNDALLHCSDPINSLIMPFTAHQTHQSSQDESMQPSWSPVRSALVFGTTVWLLVTMTGLMLVQQHYKQTSQQAEDRITQIVQPLKRAVSTINASRSDDHYGAGSTISSDYRKTGANYKNAARRCARVCMATLDERS